MSFTPKQVVGKRGEDLTCVYLSRLGYTIIDRNYWRKWGEIDVIARQGNDLRFVEVKTVVREHLPVTCEAGESYEPEDNLHPWKLKRLRRVIETYLVSKDVDDEVDWQVDAACVYLNREGELLKLDYLEDISI